MGVSAARRATLATARGPAVWVVAALLTVAGCGERLESPPAEAAGSDPAPVATPTRTRGDTVEVRLREYSFEVRGLELPSGRVVFEVENLGLEYHNMEVRRDGRALAALATDVLPGTTMYLEVTLEPGEYEVLCTVSGHDERGMRQTLVVR